MKESKLKQGLKQLIKNPDKAKASNIEIYSTEALHVIKMKNKTIDKLENLLKTHEEADRQRMLGKLNV